MGGGVDFKIPNVSYCKDANDVHFNPYNLIEFYVGEITGTTPQTVKIYTDETTFDEVQINEDNKWYSYAIPKDKGLWKIESGALDYNINLWHNSIVTKAVIKANINYNYNENNFKFNGIIPNSTVEASFKGSNTSNVTSMYGMFVSCSGLTSLDLSSFDTSKVTNMAIMFYNCSGLKLLDVSSFDTSKVTNMESMFNDCYSLESLDLSNFNTSMVTTMEDMFSGCQSLTFLDLSDWVIGDATNTITMFNDCSKLGTIRMVGCNQTTINKIKDVKPSSATITTE